MDYLLPLNTFTVVLSGAAVIGATAVRHFVQHKSISLASAARKSLLFDEAFSVMKGFFEKASLHTIEDLQTFGNNFVPSPFWVRVIRVVVPLSTQLDAGRILIDTLGEDEVVDVIGGKEWWQRTAHKAGGVDGEWISMKRDWQGLDAEGDDNEELERLRDEKIKKMKESAKEDKKRRWKEGKQREEQAEVCNAEGGDESVPEIREEESYSAEMDEMRCILYIHGGAYFFGSINTHRYSIWRYARKVGGRAFSVNYRLAPQYPFPCALADALASYLYLIRPPPGAKHKPVDPAKLTLAGDSAGGGLCLALLCLIRDAGLPAPAGAALISPWCDLTHSFPSILQNTKTDVVPAYGFLFKPSTLWPPPPPDFQERADKSTSIPGLKHAAETLQAKKSKKGSGFLPLHRAGKKGEELAKDVESLPGGDPQKAEGSMRESGHEQSKGEVGKTLKVKIDGEEVEVVDQIQLYATNEQLVYPFVSPIWQPSLGGLPPLYIMCGDKEVLRDEIIYMAHRAANPAKYPVRKALLDANPERTRKHAEYPPTRVHLQVYDGVCHDLPLFSFTVPAKYCYRAISSFIKFVTSDCSDPSLEGRVAPPSPVSATDMELPLEDDPSHPDAAQHHRSVSALDLPSANHELIPSSPLVDSPTSTSSPHLLPPVDTTRASSRHGSTIRSRSSSRFRKNSTATPTSSSPSSPTSPSREHEGKHKHIRGLENTIYSSTQPFNRPPYVDNMVRERIGVTGVVRPLESQEDMDILKIDPEDVGLIKEAPVKRYLAGKAIWDKRFKSTYEKVQKKREHHLQKSMKEEATRITKRMKEVNKKHEGPSALSGPNGTSLDSPPITTDSPEPLEQEVHGIWDLKGERPPPSSIAARKDTLEARQLARVLDEHYSKLNALNVWTEIHDIATRAVPPRHQASEDVQEEALESREAVDVAMVPSNK